MLSTDVAASKAVFVEAHEADIKAVNARLAPPIAFIYRPIRVVSEETQSAACLCGLVKLSAMANQPPGAQAPPLVSWLGCRSAVTVSQAGPVVLPHKMK